MMNLYVRSVIIICNIIVQDEVSKVMTFFTWLLTVQFLGFCVQVVLHDGLVVKYCTL